MTRLMIAVAPANISDSHCFELYEFHMVLDQFLKPWILDVSNVVPSTKAKTASEYKLHFDMLNKMLDVAVQNKR